MHAIFTKLRFLCPIRWTVRANGLLSVMDNYTALQHTWNESLESRLNAEVNSKVIGVTAEMETFDFFLGELYLGEYILRHAESLSKPLETNSISVAGGYKVVGLILKTLECFRTTKQFDLFWKLVLLKSTKLDILDTELPRKRKAPRRFKVGAGESHFPATVQEHYHRYYLEVLDLVINSIEQIFNQPGYSTLMICF